MKATFIVFLLMICCANGFEKSGLTYKKYDKNDNNRDIRLSGDRNCNTEGDLDGDERSIWEDVDFQNYNNESNFYEPCDYPDDIDCVKKFFGQFSKCKVIEQADNRPVYRARHFSYLTRINTTLITTKDRITGLDGTISRFYVNKNTNNLVMAVDFTGIDLRVKKLVFIVNRRGREPAIATDFATANHNYTATAVIPFHSGKINMKKARITSYLDNGFPPFTLGPGIAASTDPDIRRALAALYADIPTSIVEYFLTEGPAFFLAYFQKYICDFGIPLSD